MSHAPDRRSKEQKRAEIDHELAGRRAFIQRIRAEAAARGVSLTYTEIQEALQKTLQEQARRAQPTGSSASRPAAGPDRAISGPGPPQSSILTTVGCLAWVFLPAWMGASLWLLRDYRRVDGDHVGFTLVWLPLGASVAILPWLAGRWAASAPNRREKWRRFILVLLCVLVVPALGFLVFAYTFPSWGVPLTQISLPE
jgi:type VI protein secretion system component VasF